jgi:eukaryotic-like serine/threonine-protein kinase
MAVDITRAKTLFLEASGLSSPRERAEFLDHECRAEPELRARIETLLAAYETAGPFIDSETTGAREAAPTSASETVSQSPTSQPETKTASDQLTAEHQQDGAITTIPAAPPSAGPRGPVAGTVVAGRYTLREALGEGGMGTVYRADQTEPVRRQVALKLIKIGINSRAVLARFDAERQALALMDHPNIARVYDGGTTATGRRSS